jgi:hydroxymethylglutaryl-CoA lyase
MTRVQDIYPDDKVILREVGLRDGLQLVKKFPSTAAKQHWIRDEYAAGVRHFEVGSFLPATTFPQFVDVREIVATIAALPGAHGVALAVNERGVNEALATGVAEIASVVSATEEHSQANANRSRESAIANVRRLCELRDASSHKPVVNAAISMALGCSIVGAVNPAEVLRLTERLFEAGVDMVAIADTVGYAGPKQVGELTAAAVKIAGSTSAWKSERYSSPIDKGSPGMSLTAGRWTGPDPRRTNIRASLSRRAQSAVIRKSSIPASRNTRRTMT